MDIIKPEMEGYRTMEVIRAKPGTRRLPIVSLTAKAMKGIARNIWRREPPIYLAKPVNTERLLSALRMWLHR
jgi:CheY-like chemotaxis protein